MKLAVFKDMDTGRIKKIDVIRLFASTYKIECNFLGKSGMYNFIISQYNDPNSIIFKDKKLPVLKNTPTQIHRLTRKKEKLAKKSLKTGEKDILRI